MIPRRSLDLDLDETREVMDRVAELALAYRRDVASLPVAPKLDVKAVRRTVEEIDFTNGTDWRELLTWVDRHMRDDQLHTGHPRYFGLFNPSPLPLGIAADLLTAAYNPQLAAWSHGPFAVEIERRLIREFGEAFGFRNEEVDGTFCTGGAEANHTALLCALVNRFPAYATEGSRGLTSQPVVYVSPHAHHSWVKAARATGLGSAAVRETPTDQRFRLDPKGLARQIARDRKSGLRPVLVCATAGTTNAGAIDPIRAAAAVAASEGAWFHVDAAWGGAVRLAAQSRHLLDGTEEADSITFDAHKFLSIPMGAGVFLTRHASALPAAFHVSTEYMPKEADGLAVVEPYANSMQWSRRFIGLKVFLPLAAAGWGGVSATLLRQCALGYDLRRLLAADRWLLVNDSPLPVICFRSADDPAGLNTEKIVSRIIASGTAWVSTVALGVPTLRACITNLRTTELDLRALVQCLDEARSHVEAETK
jgi:glutamate/tyrosine decarboxylase-like PLP-dependent enzyme